MLFTKCFQRTSTNSRFLMTDYSFLLKYYKYNKIYKKFYLKKQADYDMIVLKHYLYI